MRDFTQRFVPDQFDGCHQPPAPLGVSRYAVTVRDSLGCSSTTAVRQVDVFDFQLALSVKTVDTYKARCMEKLELRSRADIVRFALQQGWLQSDQGT